MYWISPKQLHSSSNTMQIEWQISCFKPCHTSTQKISFIHVWNEWQVFQWMIFNGNFIQNNGKYFHTYMSENPTEHTFIQRVNFIYTNQFHSRIEIHQVLSQWMIVNGSLSRQLDSMAVSIDNANFNMTISTLIEDNANFSIDKPTPNLQLTKLHSIDNANKKSAPVTFFIHKNPKTPKNSIL